jgi:hypothetical protein
MTTTIPSVSEITPILTELGVFPDILPYNYQHQLKVTSVLVLGCCMLTNAT